MLRVIDTGRHPRHLDPDAPRQLAGNGDGLRVLFRSGKRVQPLPVGGPVVAVAILISELSRHESPPEIKLRAFGMRGRVN